MYNTQLVAVSDGNTHHKMMADTPPTITRKNPNQVGNISGKTGDDTPTAIPS